jgi:hypothetical protein
METSASQMELRIKPETEIEKRLEEKCHEAQVFSHEAL